MNKTIEHARKLLRAGQPEHAAAVLDELLAAQPRNANAIQLRAMAARQLGDAAGAEKLLRQAAAYFPKSWAAHSNLGNVLRATGRIDAAEKHLREALKLAPDSPVVMVNLANSLLDQKRFEDAAALYRKAADRDSNKPNPWRGLAIASMHSGDPKGAADAYRKLLELTSDNAATWNDLGTALMACGEIDEAETSFRKACELAPASAPPFFNLGNIGLTRGDAAGALLAYDAALERDPNLKPARINRSKARFDLGQHQTAIDELHSLLKDDPDNVDARFRLAEALERAHRVEEAASEMASLMAGPGAGRADVRHVAARVARRQGDFERALVLLDDVAAPPGDHELAGKIHNELARCLDATGEHENAFDHFTRANENYSQTFGYRHLDRTTFWKDLRTRRGSLTPEWARTLPRLENDAVQPVFLVGFPRSGTTLAEQILGAHPEVNVLGELPPLSQTIRRCHEIVGDYPAGASELSMTQLEQLRSGYLDAVRKHVEPGKGQVLIDKNPLHFSEAPFILQLFPTARFVFVMRDPRDAVLSGFMQSFAPNAAMASFLDLENAAHLYDESMKLWDYYGTLLKPAAHELRYESLLEDFEGEVRGLLEFCGLEWDEAVRNYDRSARQQVIRTPSYDQVTRPVYTSSRGRWRRYESQLAPIMGILAPHVERLGY